MVSLGKYELLERITLDQPFVSGGEERNSTSVSKLMMKGRSSGLGTGVKSGPVRDRSAGPGQLLTNVKSSSNIYPRELCQKNTQ